MPLHISRISAICFDVDGTLSDTDDLFVQKLEKVLEPIRFLLSRHDSHRAARRLVMWSEAPGNFLIGFPDTLGLDDEISVFIEWLDRHRPQSKRDYLLIPGIREMLAELSLRFPLAVVSARDELNTHKFLDYFDLSQFFKVIVTGQTAKHSKPYPDPIFFAANAMGVSPGSCLMVGDTKVDIRSGRKAGAQTIGVLCGFGEHDELKKAGADMVLTSTSELVQVFQDW